jgi:membrane-associated phospholipid phosphatase
LKGKNIPKKRKHQLTSKIKGAGIVILLPFIANLVLSLPVYADDTIERAGDIIRIVLPLAAGGMTFYRDDREGLVQYSKAFITTVSATYALKYSFDTERPNGGAHSFPSGHTSMAFSGASFLQKRYGWKYGLPAYAAASFVGWSCIESDNHYLKDVLAGAAIGVVSTYIFTDAYQPEITVTPFAGGRQYGIVLHKIF